MLEELQWDQRLNADTIDARVRNGMVTLTGTARNYSEKLYAERAARRVRGVLNVTNEISVDVPARLARSDSQLAEAVKQTLCWDSFVPHERIHAAVSNGWVTLEGTVPVFIQRIEAERAVRRLLGVRGVSNAIEVKPVPADSDTVRERVERALSRRAERAATEVSVSVHEGSVTLAGKVGSLHTRRALLGAAGHAPGVCKVEDKLTVVSDDQS